MNPIFWAKTGKNSVKSGIGFPNLLKASQASPAGSSLLLKATAFRTRVFFPTTNNPFFKPNSFLTP